MSAGAGECLALRAVSKRWPGASGPVLDAVDLELTAGEVVVVEGENGAGKTTFLRIIAGLLEADDGEVRLRGHLAQEDRMAYQQGLGVVTAGSSGLYNRLNSLQHLQLGARLAFVPRARRAGVVREMFDRFGLLDFGGRRVDRLSMGQRQRLRLAMAFVGEPALLLLDEPTASLDEGGVGLLAAALRDALAAGRSALWLCPTGAPVPVASARRLVLSGGRLSG